MWKLYFILWAFGKSVFEIIIKDYISYALQNQPYEITAKKWEWAGNRILTNKIPKRSLVQHSETNRTVEIYNVWWCFHKKRAKDILARWSHSHSPSSLTLFTLKALDIYWEISFFLVGGCNSHLYKFYLKNYLIF